MRTVRTKIFKFDELSKDAQQVVFYNLSDINTDYEWYDSIYEDAENSGLTIIDFDLDRNNINAKVYDLATSISLILENHGEETATGKLAKEYNFLLNKLESMQNIPDVRFDDLLKEYQMKLEQEYLSMLKEQYNYLSSDKAIKETIDANEYEFYSNGEMFSKNQNL